MRDNNDEMKGEKRGKRIRQISERNEWHRTYRDKWMLTRRRVGVVSLSEE